MAEIVAVLQELNEIKRRQPDFRIAIGALYDMSFACGITEKSVASVARKFHAQMRALATIGFTSSGSILADVRQVVKDGIGDAYVEGLKEGGVSFDEMSDDDATMIIELTDQQTQYMTDFVRAIRDAKGDRAAQRQILDTRIDLWTASIEAAGQAGLASAAKNEMVTWHLGATEEHCRTCNQLDGTRHRRQWYASRNYYPGKPGSALECGGFNCLCTLD